MKKKWEFYNSDVDEIKRISKSFDISELLAKILVNREIVNDEAIKTFLKPNRKDFYNPFLMLDMEKAVERILIAVKEKEKVLIYGDYDVDGITSVTVLKKFLAEIGLETDYYIPNRLEEGYGLNKDAIDTIKEKNYTLMITVDCGISGLEEIDICNKLGLDTIITDHHEQLELLPNAFAIINPKRKDNTYPFRGLAGVGVVFKLIQALSIKLGLDEKEYLKYLDIVCVGTISDIVPLINENRVITKLGLKLIGQTKNIGLKELISNIGFKEMDATTISFGIAPKLNACGRMGHQEDAIRLFLTENQNEAKKIVTSLNSYNLQRQEKEKEIFKDALSRLNDEDIENLDSIIIGGDNWHHGVIGIVASKLAEKFYKPTILICFEGEEGKGSGRSIPNFDLHEALVKTSSCLEKFGGHEMAIGISIRKDMLNEFKKEFNKIVASENKKDMTPIIKIDSQITKKDININVINELRLLEPFGEKNKTPIFIYKNLKIDSIRSLSEGKHLKLSLRDENFLIKAIGFNIGELSEEYLIGDKIDIVGTLEMNYFNGEGSIQINIKDIMKSI